MCQNDIRPDLYRERFGESLGELLPKLDESLVPFLEDAVLEACEGGYRLTAEGRLLMRPVATVFDDYLDPGLDPGLDPESVGQRRFSRTI